MPMLETGPVRLRYEVAGDGPPMLLLAPGGLRASCIETWQQAPWNPVEALRDRYRVVAMDQRNAGTSFAPITAADGWPTYAADQLAVMDHLGIERFTVVGMCIGGAFIMELLEHRARADHRRRGPAADRPRRQPRRLPGLFTQWRDEIEGDHPEATDADWEGCWANLFGGDDALWSVPDDASRRSTRRCSSSGQRRLPPLHGVGAARRTAPNATLVERWKDPADLPAARAAVDDFLAAHAAGSGSD